jgi:hypothetical protein
VAGYFPARLHRTADLPPGKPYIFCSHPHGILSYSHWLAFATEALGFSSLFPGIDCRVLTLSINFRAPIFREYLLCHGACDVSKRACLTLLNSGKSIMIAVGGGTEVRGGRHLHRRISTCIAASGPARGAKHKARTTAAVCGCTLLAVLCRACLPAPAPTTSC